ncbi:hypothetical protein G3I53_31305, partial [Streptomyces sp. SID14436]|nr:hypothetical protein [Streptomyces sp. SID14436]
MTASGEAAYDVDGLGSPLPPGPGGEESAGAVGAGSSGDGSGSVVGGGPLGVGSVGVVGVGSGSV